MHVIAAKAVAFREALAPSFKAYCAQIVANARALARGVAQRGYRVVSGGTDVHLFLLSLVDRDTTGKAGQIALERAGITTNKNMVPFDPRKPAVTSGLADRHAGRHHPRHARSGDGGDRRADRAGARSPRRRRDAGCRSRGRRAALPSLPAVSRPLGRRRLSRALSLLQRRREQGDRLPAGPRWGRDPAPPRMPRVRAALHHPRARRRDPAQGDQAGRAARGVPAREADRGGREGLPEALGLGG